MLLWAFKVSRFRWQKKEKFRFFYAFFLILREVGGMCRDFGDFFGENVGH